MAEAFGVVSGAVGAAGVAFQFAEGIRKLYQFCKDIRDAPEEIRDSLNQLQLLSYILDAIAADLQKYPIHLATHAGIPAVLEACRQGEGQMTTLLKELKSGMDQKKKLAPFKAVWRKDDLKKFVDRVERAKTSLLLAQAVYSSGQMNFGFISSNARMDQLELAVVSSTATITQTVATALVQSAAVPGHPGAVGLTNRDRKMAISSSSRWRAKRPSDRVAYLRLPFLLQRSWELAVYRASGGWHVSLTASRIVPNDSPLFKACRDGDIVKVRAMLTTGEATSRDTDEYGRNGLHLALNYCATNGDKTTYFAICQLLLKAGVDANTKPMAYGTTFELSGWLEPRFLRLLLSHEDIDSDDLELEGMGDIGYFNPETIGLWQDQMWPPWRERSLNERIKSILARKPRFRTADQFKLWITEPPEDIWAECGELSDELLVYMLGVVVRDVCRRPYRMIPSNHDGQAKSENTLRLELELASWSEFIKYGLKDKTINSAFWMVHSDTPIQRFFTECFHIYLSSTREVERMLFYITNFLYTLGLDLVALGRVEEDRQRLEGSLKIRLGYLWEENRIYMIRFNYGPMPEDWKIWWASPLDEWAGDFWASVEDADEGDEVDQEEKDMPGAWPDSEDDSSDSD